MLTYLRLNHKVTLFSEFADEIEDIHLALLLSLAEHRIQDNQCACATNSGTERDGGWRKEGKRGLD